MLCSSQDLRQISVVICNRHVHVGTVGEIWAAVEIRYYLKVHSYPGRCPALCCWPRGVQSLQGGRGFGVLKMCPRPVLAPQNGSDGGAISSELWGVSRGLL